MFNGMMDPELIRMAQEQMSRMSPSEFARIQEQMTSNPDLMRMASESMKNMRPEDLRFAAEQLKHTRPEQIAEIGEKMANTSPEELAAMRSRMDAQVTYEINGAEILKKQGNELHSQGRYDEALKKYSRAKMNVKDIPSSKARTLLLACSLNMMACYLKTSQFSECIEEGSEVLGYDENNVKALYRRGQAYKELQQLEDAVSDLNKAHEVTPNDETIAEVLRDAKERLSKQGVRRPSGGIIIEEIVEEEQKELPKNLENSNREVNKKQPETSSQTSSVNTDLLQNLSNNPESIRSFQNFISQANPETLSAMGGQAEGISPEMVKTASNLIGKMSPEELQRMIQLASSFQGENPNLKKGSSNSTSGFRSGGPIPTDMNPEMIKMAKDMVDKMSVEDRQKMFDMASTLRTKSSDAVPVPSLNSNGFRSRSADAQEGFDEEEEEEEGYQVGRGSSSNGSSESRNVSNSGFSNPTADLQEQMRNQMKDPAMRQMFSSMMQNMSPDMMASMSEQFGYKLSKEDAEKAQKAMSSLSPDDLDRMMRWADRIQKGVEVTKKTKNLVLGKTGMIFAILMLILAVILHYFGYIGK